MNRKRPPRTVHAKAWAFQAVVIAVFFAVLAYLGSTAWHRMQAQGIAYGFDIVTHATGWKINSPFLTQTPDDPYWWTLCVAFANTAAASFMAIVLASAAGFLIGAGLVANNKMLATFCRIYTGLFRNLPLVLQAVFWYITFTALPSPRENPPALLHAFILTNQGLYLPNLVIAQGRELEILMLTGGIALCGVLVFVGARRAAIPTWKAFCASVVGAAAVLSAYAMVRDLPVMVDVPRLDGFAFSGGIELPLELIALVYATVIFGAAYIAEIVRGGLQAVPRGQIEAAQALGLSATTVFLKVRLPNALRSIIPSLANQFLFIVKATAIGAAIGYSDLFAVSVVAISQTGQAIEFVFIMMLVYFALNYSITQLMNYFNRKLNFEGSRS
jgi:general L-amino acid transport system permease protein